MAARSVHVEKGRLVSQQQSDGLSSGSSFVLLTENVAGQLAGQLISEAARRGAARWKVAPKARRSPRRTVARAIVAGLGAVRASSGRPSDLCGATLPDSRPLSMTGCLEAQVSCSAAILA